MTSIEHRDFVEPVEFRSQDNKLVAAGYAYVFNRLSQNLGGFVEQVAPGAGKRALGQQHDVVALFNHDENQFLGRRSSGTLRMEEDDTGGAYEIDLPDTTVGRDVAHLLERGDLKGSSFGFRTIEDEWGETDEGFPLRTLKQFSIRDVGPVALPAYLDTTAALRSLADQRDLDIDLLVAASKAGELRSLLSQESDDEARVPRTLVRERISWLTC